MAGNKILFFFSSALMAICLLLQVTMAADPIKEGSCMVKLLPCKDFFKPDSTDPPATCCDPLSEIVLNEPTCLCQAVSHPSISDSIKVSLHDVLELTNKCGAKVDSSVCDETALLAAEAAPSPNAQAATSQEIANSLAASLGNSTKNGTVDAAAANSLVNQFTHGSGSAAAGPGGAEGPGGAAASGPSGAAATTPAGSTAASATTSSPYESFGLVAVLVASYVSTIFI